MVTDATSTELRCRPRQQRSAATFESILETAASLLERYGMRAFTTNLLAEESGVSVRAIYRYFPNKHAVVAELAQRMETRWNRAVDAVGDLSSSRPWDELWVAYVDAFVGAVRSTPGALVVLAAMRDDPDLRAIDDVANRRYIAGISAALRARRPMLAVARADAVATVLMRSMVAVLDEAFVADASTAAALIDALKLMHVRLLADVLEGTDP